MNTPQIPSTYQPQSYALACRYFHRSHIGADVDATLTIGADDSLSLVLGDGTTLFSCYLSEVKRVSDMGSSVFIALKNGSRYSITPDLDASKHSLQLMAAAVAMLAAPKVGNMIAGSTGAAVGKAVGAAGVLGVSAPQLANYNNLDVTRVLPMLQYLKLKGVPVHRSSVANMLMIMSISVTLLVVVMVSAIIVFDIDINSPGGQLFLWVTAFTGILLPVGYFYSRTYR